MAFVVRVLPSPPPPAPATPARWRLALAVTCAVGLASLGFSFANFSGMAVGFLSCGDGEELSVSRATQGEHCPVFRAAFTVFRVSSISMAVASRLLDLLRTCLARSKAKEQKVIFRGTYWLRFWSLLQHKEKTNELFMKASTCLEMVALELFASHGWKNNDRLCQAAATVKSLDYAIIFEHLVPATCIFLIIVGILLESRCAKGSLMETAGSVIFYVGMGMIALICVVLAIVAVMAVVVVLCIVMAITAMAVWECCSTVETKP